MEIKTIQIFGGKDLNCIELFSGAGGLAIGLWNAGFRHKLLLDFDKNACATLRENQRYGYEPFQDCEIYEGDVQSFDYTCISTDIHIVAGGPPCQPFSTGGKHRGKGDKRDMFPEATRAIRELTPYAFIFENVKGLTRPSFLEYFEYIIRELSDPLITKKNGEDWRSHSKRLLRESKLPYKRLAYDVKYKVIDAADYGVPQRRERVVIVGVRKDLGLNWEFPKPTHTQEALLLSQWVKEDYWDRHLITTNKCPEPSKRFIEKIRSLQSGLFPPVGEPWATVRDAINSLPSPKEPASKKIANHYFRPGARSYPGHTGSPLDEPAKTLKAGVHGVPGGENMLRYPNGQVRYFSIREAARLQTFPDEIKFQGAWSECMRQIGNAVPVKFATLIGQKIKYLLESRTKASVESHNTERRNSTAGSMTAVT